MSKDQNFISNFLLEYEMMVCKLKYKFGLSSSKARKLLSEIQNHDAPDMKLNGSVKPSRKRGRPRKRYHEDDKFDEAIAYGILKIGRVSTTLLQRKTGRSYTVCKKAMEFVPRRYRAPPRE